MGAETTNPQMPPPNNGMHPTPYHAASHESCMGARVMPGVMPLLNHAENKTANLFGDS